MSNLEDTVRLHVRVDENGHHIVQNTEEVEQQLGNYPRTYTAIKEGLGLVINYMDQAKEEILKNVPMSQLGKAVLSGPLKLVGFQYEYHLNIQEERQKQGGIGPNEDTIAVAKTVSTALAGWSVGAMVGAGLVAAPIVVPAGVSFGAVFVAGSSAALLFDNLEIKGKSGSDWFANTVVSSEEKLSQTFKSFTKEMKFLEKKEFNQIDFPSASSSFEEGRGVGSSFASHFKDQKAWVDFDAEQSDFSLASPDHLPPLHGIGMYYVEPKKVHTVGAGDTVWKVAKDYGLSVNDLLRIPENGHLFERMTKDKEGRTHIKILPGETIHIPESKSYTPSMWHQESHYGSPIRTSTGSYDFTSQFNQGSFKSPYLFARDVAQPFHVWSRWEHFNIPSYDKLLETLGEMEMDLWDMRNYKDTHFQRYQELFAYKKSPDNGDGGQKFDFADFKPYRFGAAPDVVARQHVTKFQEGAWSNVRYGVDHTGTAYAAYPIKGGQYGTLVLGGGGPSATLGIDAWSVLRRHPLIVDLEDDGVVLTPLSESSVFYDAHAEGYLSNMGWSSAADALLAIDMNGDGIINQAKEIIFKSWHKDAVSDLDGLRKAFDVNNDGKIDAEDAVFEKLYLWQDHNQNGVSEPGELTKMADAGIEAFHLDDEVPIKGEATQGGNQILKAVRIQTNGKMMGGLYDTVLEASQAGLRVLEEEDHMTLVYPDREDQIYKVYSDHGEHVDLESMHMSMAVGGAGSDFFQAPHSGSVIDGGAGNDMLIGGRGNDWLKGGPGKDHLSGGAGHDILFIDAEDDLEGISGGKDMDVALVATQDSVSLNLTRASIEAAYGNAGNDMFTAEASPVRVFLDGGAGDDILEGGDHNDILVGGKGRDVIRGGKGDDSLFIDVEDDMDQLDGGEGFDSAYIGGKLGISFDAAKHRVERVFGSLGNDTLFSTGSDAVTLVGHDGDDVLTGGSGDDILDGGKGNDTLRGGAGSDKYYFKKGYGHDVIMNEKYQGTSDLVLLGSGISQDELIFTRKVDDLVLSLRGNTDDSLTIKNWYTAPSTEGVISHEIDGFILQADNADASKTILFKSGGDQRFAVEGNDPMVVMTMDGNDAIQTGQGGDYVDAGAGVDKIESGDGDDTLTGGPGDGDQLHGWRGNDTYLFNRGDGKDSVTDVFEYPETIVTRVDKVRVETHHKTVTNCFRMPYSGEHCVSMQVPHDVSVPYIEETTRTEKRYSSGGDNDRILFGMGIAPEDVVMHRIGSDLLLSVREKGVAPDQWADQLRLTQWFDPNYKIESMAFKDHPERTMPIQCDPNLPDMQYMYAAGAVYEM